MVPSGDPLMIHSGLQLIGAVLANRSELDEALSYYERALGCGLRPSLDLLH